MFSCKSIIKKYKWLWLCPNPILTYYIHLGIFLFSAVFGFICCKRKTRKIAQKFESNIELQEIKSTVGTNNLRDHIIPEIQCLLNQNRIIFRNQPENLHLPYYSNQYLNNTIPLIDQNNQSDFNPFQLKTQTMSPLLISNIFN